ncbi:MAG TPA: CDP-diacylglycerol--serine O-phosphatidyltransferase [Bacteroidota bacterium]|nr:CDP-diacylglycerol--serine O-phosphatidyltransferase [Bacteroidota bacterium]
MKITRAVVPSLFTVLNMFCGFLSIANSSDGQFDVAAWFIILGGIFDSLDGVMARITRSSSEFGVEFDSLSDIVTFGAAPAFLVYKLQLFQLQGVGLIISSLLLIFGGIRLARFNVQLVGFDKDYFSGLPIPASAITIVAFVLTFRDEVFGLRGFASDMLAPMVVVVSLLMVSKVKYDTLPKFSKKEFKRHPVRVVSFVAAAFILVISRGRALFYLFAAFLLLGVIRYAYGWLRHILGFVDAKAEEEQAEEATSYDI